jgi:hypothetical protein
VSNRVFNQVWPLNKVFNIRVIPQHRNELAGAVVQAVFNHPQEPLHE